MKEKEKINIGEAKTLSWQPIVQGFIVMLLVVVIIAVMVYFFFGKVTVCSGTICP